MLQYNDSDKPSNQSNGVRTFSLLSIVWQIVSEKITEHIAEQLTSSWTSNYWHIDIFYAVEATNILHLSEGETVCHLHKRDILAGKSL